MDGARDQLLPGSRLPLDQHGGRDGRHLLDLDEHFLDGGGFTDDAGALLKLAPLEQAAHGRDGFVGIDRLEEPCREPDTPRQARGIRLGRLHQAERRDRTIVRERDEMGGRCVVETAGENDTVRVPALRRVPHVVEGRRQGRLEPCRFELRVDAHRMLEVVGRDENAISHQWVTLLPLSSSTAWSRIRSSTASPSRHLPWTPAG